MDGKGSFDINNNSYNDIIIVFHHSIDEQFRVDYKTNDVHVDLQIGIDELLCGFHKTLHIYGEELVISSDKYIDPSKPRHVRNKGLPNYKKKDGGDLVIHFEVAYPKDEESLRKYHKIFLSVFKKEPLQHVTHPNVHRIQPNTL
jgi:DnaJ-class molecular chaperone